jgi:redox-sensitive bicupin YhaK (pirin superfamily)
MITMRRAAERGHSDRGWLNSYHTFSFGSYSDPQHMGFRALRVLNDDRVAPGKGFGAHGHRDMEILSYVLEGSLAHKDSMGEQHALRPNEVQAMTAGTGVIHSEFNGSATEPVHFLQIWIVPADDDLDPAYQQFAYDPEEKRGRLRLIAGPDRQSTPRAAFIHQDARMYASVLHGGESAEHRLSQGRYGWVQCAAGRIAVNGVTLETGDGVAISNEPIVTLQAADAQGGELLLFDLA